MAQTKAQLVVGLNVNASAPASALQIDASGNVNLDSNTLYVDATNNRVGIGTSSPDSGSVLDARGNVYTGNGTVKNIIGNSGGNAIVGTSTTHPLQLYTNGSVALTIDTSQRVGIGTSANIGAPLHITENSSTSTAIRLSNNANAAGTYSQIYFSYSPTDTSYGAAIRFSYPSTSDPGGTISFLSGSSLSERARIDSSGRLLVGTSSTASPHTSQFALHGAGSGYSQPVMAIAAFPGTDDFSSGYFEFYRSASGTLNTNTLVGSGDQLGTIRWYGANGTGYDMAASISASVDGTPGASNDMPGRLVFSTTADGASSPTERMRISSSGGFTSTAVANDVHSFANLNSTTFNSTLLTLSTYRNTTNSSYAFFSCIRQGFAIALQILDSGNVLNANNSYGALSDLKLKENIVDAGSQWDDLKALKVRKYNFKEETGNPTHTQIGLIAQEVELVSPGLVYETPDRSEEGEHLDSVTKNVNYSVLYMKAVKALQEAMERIEQLEAEMVAVKAQLS